MKIAIVKAQRRSDDIALNLQIVPIIKAMGHNVYQLTSDFFGELPSDKSYKCLKTENTIIEKYLAYFYRQIKISESIYYNRKKLDILIFHVATDLILPMVVSKILKKKTILMASGSISENLKVQRKNFLLVSFFSMIERLNYNLCDHIIAYSKSCIMQFDLTKYNKKISIAHEHFLDVGMFSIKKEFANRETRIGYLGRLSKEKGILNLIGALEILSNNGVDFRASIIGDGPLRKDAENRSLHCNLNLKIDFLGYCKHDSLPEILNELKFLIIPSYTEGLPNAVLEAMSCGVVVISTPVGALPDVICDGQNGFLIKDNSPNAISEKIIQVINNSKIGIVSQNAIQTVHTEFTFDKTVQAWNDAGILL